MQRSRTGRQAGSAGWRAGLGLAFVLALAVVACRRPAAVEVFTGATMGTTYTVKVVAPAGADSLSGGRAAVAAAITARLDEVDRKMSTYRADSEVSRFNRHSSDAPFAISPGTAAVLAVALRISRETGGAFDPTVGPLVDAWGFGPGDADGRPDGPPPEAVARLRERVGHEWVELPPGGGALRKLRPDVALDLSAVAKGYAVDRVAEALVGLGLANYMVEVGGEVRVAGRNAAGTPWRIGIEQPWAGARRVERVASLPGGAMATSGDYRNFRQLGDRRRSHLIDPRTGYPIEHELASVSVVCDNCLEADGYATALMVLGPEEGFEFARARGMAALFLVRTAGDGVAERGTPAFERRFGRGRRMNGGAPGGAEAIVAVVLVAIAMAGLGAGVLLRGRCSRWGCGGGGADRAAGDEPSCPSCPRRRGFSLLELLLALAIAGLVVGALVQNHLVSMRLRQRAARREQALALADRMLARLLLEGTWPAAGEVYEPVRDEDSGLEWWAEGRSAPGDIPGAVVVRVAVQEPGGGAVIEELVTAASRGSARVR